MMQTPTATFDDLCEQVDPPLLPYLDRYGDMKSHLLSYEQLHWAQNGYLIVQNAIPSSLIDAYCDVRGSAVHCPNFYHGWPAGTPYMQHETIRDLCLYRPLTHILDSLIGEPMAMHLNLTGWVSTERNYHMDEYLNPDYINSHYLAVWYALDDIHPDSGPFEYVPGSHRWPTMRNSKVMEHMPPEWRSNPDWPKLTEEWISGLFEKRIRESGLPVKQFIANKGDVLIWHSRLAHRGSPPKDRSLLRKAIIAHFSAISHRRDMPRHAQHKDQGRFFIL